MINCFAEYHEETKAKGWTCPTSFAHLRQDVNIIVLVLACAVAARDPRVADAFRALR